MDYLSSEVDCGLISIEWDENVLQEEAFDDDATLLVQDVPTLGRGKTVYIPKAMPITTTLSTSQDIPLQSYSLERDKAVLVT